MPASAMFYIAKDKQLTGRAVGATEEQSKRSKSHNFVMCKTNANFRNLTGVLILHKS